MLHLNWNTSQSLSLAVGVWWWIVEDWQIWRDTNHIFGSGKVLQDLGMVREGGLGRKFWWLGQVPGEVKTSKRGRRYDRAKGPSDYLYLNYSILTQNAPQIEESNMNLNGIQQGWSWSDQGHLYPGDIVSDLIFTGLHVETHELTVAEELLLNHKLFWSLNSSLEVKGVKNYSITDPSNITLSYETTDKRH